MLQKGQVVYSAAGHDKDSFYVVVEVDRDGCCRIADGRRRGLGSPKRKNPKHLRPTRQSIDPGMVPTDRALRRALAGLRGEEPGEQEEPVAYPQAGPGVPDRP